MSPVPDGELLVAAGGDLGGGASDVPDADLVEHAVEEAGRGAGRVEAPSPGAACWMLSDRGVKLAPSASVASSAPSRYRRQVSCRS